MLSYSFEFLTDVKYNLQLQDVSIKGCAAVFNLLHFCIYQTPCCDTVARRYWARVLCPCHTIGRPAIDPASTPNSQSLLNGLQERDKSNAYLRSIFQRYFKKYTF